MDNRVFVQFRQPGRTEQFKELAGIEHLQFPLTADAPVGRTAPISLVIPTFFNRQLKSNSLCHLLAGLEESKAIREVILVGSDGEELKPSDYQPLVPHLPVRVVSAPPHNRAASRNIGVKKARCRFVMFLDDDMLIKHWRLADVLISAVLSGDYQCALFPRRHYLRFPLLFDPWCLAESVKKWRSDEVEKPFLLDPIESAAKDPALMFCFPGCFTLIEKEAYNKFGGFNERFLGWGYEDAEFGLRAMRKLRVLNLFRQSEPFLHIDHPVSPYKSDEVRANWRRFQKMTMAVDLREFSREVFTGEHFPRNRSSRAAHLDPFQELKSQGIPIDLREVHPWARQISRRVGGLTAGKPDFILLHGSRAGASGSANAATDYDLLFLYNSAIQDFFTSSGTPRVEIECADRSFFAAISQEPWMFDHRGALEFAKIASATLLAGDTKTWETWRSLVCRRAYKNGHAYWLTLAVGLKLQGSKYGSVVERYFDALSRIFSAGNLVYGSIPSFQAPLEVLAEAAVRALEMKPGWREKQAQGRQVFALQVPEIWIALEYLSRRPAVSRSIAKTWNAASELPTVICTIEASLPQLVGACMQYLSFRTSTTRQCHYLLRIVEGESDRFILALAQAAGFNTQLVKAQHRNRFLNKWTGLEKQLAGRDGPILLLDWDILYGGGKVFPKIPAGKLLLRQNPADMYGDLAELGREISPTLWNKDSLLSSVNGGVVFGQSQPLLRLARRTIEIHAIIETRLPETPPWKAEQCAVSMAAGEIGCEALPPEWNVVPASNVADSEVRLWHYNDGYETTRRLKQELAEPHRVEALLKKLSEHWPAQAERMSKLYPQAIDTLGASRFLSGSRKRATTSVRPPEERTLVCACSSGLSNRLLMICGALRIAHLTGRRFVLYWPVNAELGCSFDKLFTRKFPMFTNEDLDYLLESRRVVSIYNTWNCSGPLYTEISEDGDPDVETVILKGWYIPKFRNEEFSGRLYQSVLGTLAELPPHPDVLREVSSFPLPEETIGVHIRRVEPLKEFLQSRDEDFEEIMKALVKCCPRARFLLATDDRALEEKFRRRFGDRILSRPAVDLSRDTEAGIRAALVELILLSRTKAVLGTYWSSFSYTASALGKIPFVAADQNTAGPGLANSVDQLMARLRRQR